VAWQPDYTTLARAKDFVRVADTVDDIELAAWITAASRAVDDKTNRQFGQAVGVAARTYRRAPYYDRSTGFWVLEIDDVQVTTGLLVNGVAYASSGCTLLPDTAALDGRPYTQLGFTFQPYESAPGVPQSNVITAQFGWTAVPVQVEAAVWLQLNRWNARRDSPYGIAGSPDTGSEMRLLAKLDPDVATTLAGLTRRRRVG
jgi:hypothetical protein